MNEREPLLELLRELAGRDYDFAVVTPPTHARVLSRPAHGPPTLRDIFGWNRTFAPGELPAPFAGILERAQGLEVADAKLRSKVRVASLGGYLFVHSSYPTEQHDSVFFGPDTYRFTRFVAQRLPSLPTPDWAIDMGAGAGAGALAVARISPRTRVTAIDRNLSALRFAAVNARHAGASVETLQSTSIPQGPDLIIANPPYMMDASSRVYRDGGNLLGGAITLEWVQQALRSLTPNGTMLLYTGAAYVGGRSPLIEAVEDVCRRAGASLSIEELDPDVFGEELEGERYREVERIAVLGAVITLG